MAAHANPRRVLVYFSHLHHKELTKANFTQSIMDALKSDGDVSEIYVRMNGEDQMQLSQEPFSDSNHPVKIKRPPFCPIKELSADQIRQLPEEIVTRGIDTGACVVLESADGKLLLTRRAKHLRSFPGIWVPPGGHMEYGESVQEAGLRELREETGLTITPDMCVGQQIPVLAMWESAYPPMMSMGLPQRHHIVSYMNPTLKMPFTSKYMHALIKLNTKEVGACAWLDKPLLTAIAAKEDGNIQHINTDNLPKTFSALIVERDGSTHTEDISTSAMLRTATGDKDEDIERERVSTGTKFAIAEWLAKRDILIQGSSS